MDPPSGVVVLPPVARAPALAREHARRLGSDWSAELMDVVLLVVSEAVTNAVRYGHGHVELSILPSSGRIRIEVTDANPAPPRRRESPDGLAERGRGLYLLDALTTAWGMHPRNGGQGKTIWLDVTT